MTVTEAIPKTALDVFKLLPEGTLCEVIDNILYMSPAPKLNHQQLLLLFARKISDHVDKSKLGEVIVAPFDVYLEHLQSAVQPDLTYVAKSNSEILKSDGYIHGVPDMIIEVLSSDKKRDLVMKKDLYERAGVREYFIADPVTRQVIAFSLNNSVFKLMYDETGLFKSPLLNFEFTF